MANVWVFQHSACETLGIIAPAVARPDLTFRKIRPYLGEPVPKGLDGADSLILLGGPMGVNDQEIHPWLKAEIRLIEQALRAGKPILGVCLGSQLLAAALGATVRRGKEKEIGWHPVSLTPHAASDPVWRDIESPVWAFHWHGDLFELPAKAVSLGFSALTECQMFRNGDNTYGLLFHAEVTERIIAEMLRTFEAEVRETGQDPARIAKESVRHLPRLQQIGQTIYWRWATLV